MEEGEGLEGDVRGGQRGGDGGRGWGGGVEEGKEGEKGVGGGEGMGRGWRGWGGDRKGREKGESRHLEQVSIFTNGYCGLGEERTRVIRLCCWVGAILVF